MHVLHEVSGAELRPNTKVKSHCGCWRQDDRSGVGGRGKVLAPVVVNAAGSWANLLMRPLGVGLPFTRCGVIFGLREQTPGVFRQTILLR